MPLPKRLDALTGLRFVAAMMIVFCHFDNLRLAKMPFNWHLAVSFFFVLSGFIMMYVHPHIVSVAQASRFFWDRVTRIWPAHALVLVAYVVLLGYPIGRYFWANLFLVHSFWPIEDAYWAYNYPSWSLSVEMVFYALFPLIALGWRTTWWWKVASALAMPLLVIALATAFHVGAYDGDRTNVVNDIGLLYINPVSRMSEFVLGMVCCSMFKASYPNARPNLLLFSGFEALAVLSFAFVFSGRPEDFAARHLGHAAYTAFASFGACLPASMAMVLAFAFGRGLLSRLFASRLCVYLGDISFSIYVTHAFVYDYYKSLHRPDDDLAGALVCVAATLLVSALLYHLFETPVRLALRRLPDRITAWRGGIGIVDPRPPEEPGLPAGVVAADLEAA